eukprot:CAMPEP_0206403690 /NCGR_PEP_ID=MMETSP0294-20121207/27865_1 /ASSEMBLY_ACC=CAM_ASM_000327 /TAXON_ID=39354 /ORGANISM="Heterosigma akashiwo, Strain CCMP2393" /LENGTH=42 /DNA_ID= /DNA_START= /DNA_END= /DNA_ORIENTATION=
MPIMLASMIGESYILTSGGGGVRPVAPSPVQLLIIPGPAPPP